ncbi:hypothetical protein L3Q82_026827 [Scortum barcoo]|uniref:Uncharacterized protein n=1 Tax=Scortum barcoo TaxID=214431 RepID=A0ACB8WMU4_9TELE|nr:hypothetical protein L3Q82_026827 [Scortum barcoo]
MAFPDCWLRSARTEQKPAVELEGWVRHVVVQPGFRKTKHRTQFLISREAPPASVEGLSLRQRWIRSVSEYGRYIFNNTLRQAVVPTCLKTTTIIRVPKKSSPSCFNDYRPVALTPILMKCFERLVLKHIRSVLPPSLGPFQFAYWSNRSTTMPSPLSLHTALTHLDTKDLYVRMLAFNTIIPQQLILKLDQLGINTSLCLQLAAGLPDQESTSSTGQQEHILHHHTEH